MFFGRDLSNGEFGCILAHKSIYEHIVENNIGAALILEDDAILCDELPDVISALTRNPEIWDLVRFLGREKNYRASRKIARLPGTQSYLARPHDTPGGAYGYIISNQAARRLLSMMEKNWLPIDTLHGVSWLTKLNTVSVIPSPVLPNDQVPSCIDEQDQICGGINPSSFPVEKTDLPRDAWRLEDLQQCVDKIHMVRYVDIRPQAFQAAREVLSVLPNAGWTCSAHPLDLPESPRLDSCHT